MSEAPTKPPGLNEASRAFLHNWEPTKRHDRPLTEGGKQFELVSDFAPSGDQPQAIEELVAWRLAPPAQRTLVQALFRHWGRMRRR